MHSPSRGCLVRFVVPASVPHSRYSLSTASAVTEAAAARGRATDLDGGHEAEIPVADCSFWNKKIRLLCSGLKFGGHGVDEALRLLDRLRSRGHRPDSLCLSSLVHGLCDAGRFPEAHNRLLLFVASGWVPDDRTCNVLVSRLLAARSPEMTFRVLDNLIAAKPAFVASVTNYNRLIDQFCSLSRPADARKVFLDMKSRGQQPNIVSYTALINGFGRVGELDVAQQLFDEMRDLGIPPNSLTYSVLLKGVLRKRMIETARTMMSELWASMVSEEDSSVKNAAFANLVDALCREGVFHELFRLAEEMPPERCVSQEFGFGQMIDSLCRVGRHHGASRIVYLMRKRGLTPSLVSYNSIVHGLSQQGEGGCMRAYQLFKEGAELGYVPPESTYRSLVQGLCRVKGVQKARDVAEFMLGRGDVDATRIYNIFLHALRLLDDPTEQLNVLVAMLQSRCPPDVVTLNTVIDGFCGVGKVDEALKILNDMLQGKFCPPDVVTFTTILRGLLDAGRVKEALDIFHRAMPENSCSPNTVTYNALLHGLCRLQSVEEAVSIFDEMGRNSVAADCRTHTIVMDGLLGAGLVTEAKAFWEDVVWPSKIHDDFVYAAVLRGLCKLGRLNEACDFLYELIDCGVAPGIVGYNVLIDSACKLNLKKQAYRLVAELRKNGLIPDAVTWRILGKLHESQEVGANPSIHASDPVGFSRQEEATTNAPPTGESPSSAKKGDELCRQKRSGGAAESVVDFSPSTIRSPEENNKHSDRQILFSPSIGAKEPAPGEPLSRIVRRVLVGLL